MDGCHKNGINDRINVTRWIERDIDISLNTSLTAKDVEETGDEREERGVHEKRIKCNVEVGDEISGRSESLQSMASISPMRWSIHKTPSWQCISSTIYPKEFMASLLSNTPNAVNLHDHSNKFVDYFAEAKRMGIKIFPPNVKDSNERFTPTKDGIISGFGFIKDLGVAACEDIVSKRPWKTFDEFLMRMNGKAINKSSMYALVYAGCFDDYLPYNSKGKPGCLEARFNLLEEDTGPLGR